MLAPPAASHDRLIAMDVTRGVAVLGILLMNIVAFAMPESAQLSPYAYGGSDAVNVGIWTADYVLIQGKMRALFTLLFGASMLLVIERADASGENGFSVHFWRMAWLFVIGLLHLFYIWSGDILTLYAMTGMVAFAFVDMDAKRLVRWSLLMFALQFLLSMIILLSLAAARSAATAPDASAEAIMAWQDVVNQVSGGNAAVTEAVLGLYRDSYSAILAYRFAEDFWHPWVQFMTFGAETLAIMLLGMALLKSGFFRGSWESRRYKRIALILPPVCAAAFVALALWKFSSGFDPVPSFGIDLILGGPLAAIMAVGYAAFIVRWALTMKQGWLKQRLEAAGKAAFTNYIGTSILMTTIFYGYGLGLFGYFDRIALLGFVLLGWIVMLAWSKPWLDHFRHGPLEWVWRSLSRGRPQPMRLT